MTDNEKPIEEARDREGALESTATAIRLSLRFDLGWSSDEARTLGAVLAGPVATRLARFRRSEVPETAPELFPGTLDALDSLTIRKEEA